MKFFQLILLPVLIDSAPHKKWIDSHIIHNTWSDLKHAVTFRYFHPSLYESGGSEQDIWDMGQNLECTINSDLSVDLILPDLFDFVNPFKIYAHDFVEDLSGGKTQYVDAWMDAHNKEVNVILMNWGDMSHSGEVVYWESLQYYDAAFNALDLGEYLGLCLAEITRIPEYPVSSYHLIGQGLASHMMAKAGRTYFNATGRYIDRITGLDPAGIGFVRGMVMEPIPILNDNRIGTDAANFVDIIHSDAGLKPSVFSIPPKQGDLHSLGHMDFYPAGGSEQPGCELGGADHFSDRLCSNSRSSHYFLHSIRNPELFPSKECRTVSSCSEKDVISDSVAAFMGSESQHYFSGEHKLFYLDITDHHWNFYEHSHH